MCNLTLCILDTFVDVDVQLLWICSLTLCILDTTEMRNSGKKCTGTYALDVSKCSYGILTIIFLYNCRTEVTDNNNLKIKIQKNKCTMDG